MHHVTTARASLQQRASRGLVKPFGLGAVWIAACASMLLLGCATEPTRHTTRQDTTPSRLRERIARAEEGLADDRAVQAEVAAVEATRAREDSAHLIDEVQVRVGDTYIDDDHRVRVLARVPLNRPGAIRAERDVARAETEIAISRLEEVALERRSEACFPAMESLAWEERQVIYAAYAERQAILLDWNHEGRSSGTTNELSSARFELQRRIKLANWEGSPPIAPPGIERFQLPEIGAAEGGLVKDFETLRTTVRQHHPTMALQRATGDRYRAMAARARAQSQPWIKFVDLSYQHRTEGSEDGVGGQVAFEIPLGGKSQSNVGRYEALGHRERGAFESTLEEQLNRSVQALDELSEFETLSSRWHELEELAAGAEEIANRWWKRRLAKPSAVASLFDEAFAARLAVIDARERAGNAYCTILAMTGVSPEDWPRESTRRD